MWFNWFGIRKKRYPDILNEWEKWRPWCTPVSTSFSFSFTVGWMPLEAGRSSSSTNIQIQRRQNYQWAIEPAKKTKMGFQFRDQCWFKQMNVNNEEWMELLRWRAKLGCWRGPDCNANQHHPPPTARPMKGCDQIVSPSPDKQMKIRFLPAGITSIHSDRKLNERNVLVNFPVSWFVFCLEFLLPFEETLWWWLL